MGRQDGENERGQYVPFASIGEQLQVVRRAADSPHSLDKRLAEMNKRAAAGLQGAVGADGGFLLQVDFSADLMQNAIETGLLASRCRRFPVSPGATGIEFPVVEETSRVDGSRYGGVQVYWAAEAEAATKTKPKFSIERLTFQKLLGMCVVTDEMLKDAAFLGSFIGQAFSEEFAYKIDDGIVRGTGSGQMLGILNAGCLVSVAKETSQVADTIVGENVLKMRGRQLSRSRANSVWLINQDCEPQVHTLSIVKSKSDVPLYNPADGLNRPLDSIMGRPVVTIEQASTVGDKGDIILADLSYYALITQDFEQASSVHVYFDTQQTAFRFSMRINGQPMMKSALTPARGSNTLSPFIVLDDRA
jgi:HK97 family phage major capsid protein